MGRWPAALAFLVVPPFISGAAPAGAAKSSTIVAAPGSEVKPPVAARRPVRFKSHGIVRVDDYAWLRDPHWREAMRDPSRLAPDISAYIAAENAYSEAVLAPLADVRSKLIHEMKDRIEQDDSGVPSRDGNYAYWRRFVPGAEHPQIMRSRADGSGEEVLLDGSALAAGKPYFSFGDTQHSPNQRLMGYSVDETGSEVFSLHIRDVEAQRNLPDVVTDVADFAWAADSATLFYVRLDADHRPRFVYRHRIGDKTGTDALVYSEKDLAFEVSVYLTRTQRFVVISTGSADTSEAWLIDAARPQTKPVLVAKRKPQLRYYVDDWGDQLVIRTNADGAADFKVVTAPASAPARKNWRDLVPYRQGRQILSILPFAHYLASLEREDGLDRLIIRRESDAAAHAVSFNEEAYDLDLGSAFEFDTRTVRFTYSSPATPLRVFDYDMDSRERVLRKESKVPSGHDPTAYVVRRLFVTTGDKEDVPITVLHRKDLRLDGSALLFLEGYGAYGYTFPTEFDSNLFSLVDRGFVYAIAHVRGGLEKGESWHDGGRRDHKLNSFSDFIAAAEYLIEAGYTARGRIVARGDSAGGLLIAGVANMRPDLFAGLIARVPFVDCLNTMLDNTLPLTASDVPEWGDPIKDATAYQTIAAYSPYDNVKAQAYPHMLVTAGISDSRVAYWEPAKWVAKLRAMKTNDARIILVTQTSAGHFGPAGRFVELDEAALIQAFALAVTGASGVAGFLPEDGH